jgi:hypothetical protein
MMTLMRSIDDEGIPTGPARAIRLKVCIDVSVDSVEGGKGNIAMGELGVRELGTGEVDLGEVDPEKEKQT